MDKRKLTIALGVFLGLIGPLITMYTFYFFNFNTLEFEVFIDRLLYSTLFAPVLSLCVLINLLLFFVFIWLNKDEGSRGVLLTTILYALLILGMKLF